MFNKMDKNKIIRGSFGAIWFNGEEVGSVKSFEAKVALDYEDVDIMGDLGKHKRYMGYAGEGTMTLHKIDSAIAKLIGDAIKSGNMPDFTIVAKLEDPSADGAERVELTGVTINELMAIKFENKSLREEEVPFAFSHYRFIDLI
nr:MAG TPA: tail tube protein [Caudoviricetes sp.]